METFLYIIFVVSVWLFLLIWIILGGMWVQQLYRSWKKSKAPPQAE